MFKNSKGDKPVEKWNKIKILDENYSIPNEKSARWI